MTLQRRTVVRFRQVQVKGSTSFVLFLLMTWEG